MSTTTDLYDPQTNSWRTVASMGVPRDFHAAIRVSGGALVCGGFDEGAFLPTFYRGCERYDVAADQWENAPSMLTGRTGFDLIELRDGRILAAGGVASTKINDRGTAAVEILDPNSGLWTAAAPMNYRRAKPSVALLLDGRVLVVGGEGPDADGAEIYDPSSNSWTAMAPPGFDRISGGIVVLDDGRVLVAGGVAKDGLGGTVQSTSLLFNPTSGIWTPAPDIPSNNGAPTLVLLSSGRVLATGLGMSPHIFDPFTNTWSMAGYYLSSRGRAEAVRLLDGRVLVVGGDSGGTAEIYQ